jgi:folate-dependent tRNA-U54 methylase TrmFO/GidA
MNIHFGLLPPIGNATKIPKTEKQKMLCERALNSLSSLVNECPV